MHTTIENKSIQIQDLEHELDKSEAARRGLKEELEELSYKMT